MHHHAPPHIPISVPLPTGQATGSPQAGWVSTGELARLLKVDAPTLRRWRTARPPKGPAFIRLSPRRVMYSLEDIRQWLAQHRVDPAQAA
ncbi:MULTISPECIES: helix-turn-helix transcriptional regulator [Streptomyces]|uniref:helix-turn-helix transcriptional regulator n=1 Tax=Streptomyces TaxID=1883 RepID=UPI00345C0DF0